MGVAELQEWVRQGKIKVYEDVIDVGKRMVRAS